MGMGAVADEAAGLELLESDGMREPLELAVKTIGGSVREWRLSKLQHRPGAGATGIFSVEVAFADRPDRTEYVCVTSANVPECGLPMVRLQGGGTNLTAWLYPGDPVLVGLAAACDAAAVAQVAFGGGTAELRMVNYRPLRRAVLTAVQGDKRVFVKVVRPDRAAALLRRHRMLIDAGIPAPEAMAGPADGVVVLREVPGIALAEALMDDGARDLDPQSLINLLHQLPVDALKLSRRPAWAERSTDYAKAAAAVLPGEQERIFRLAERIARLVAVTEAGPVVPTHGDFYEANILADGGRITGLLDVDSLGPGHLVDDLACFIGHLAVLPAVHSAYVHIPQAMERFLQVFDREVDPAGLRGRAAGVALSLVAGAKTAGSQDWEPDALQRLAAAEELAAAADQLSEASR
ncbi:aminoglycoside phosphotransferase [Arthrobacter crystallopoietes BAB-32]|uniref:Aminoglycoside phosphotransferase n=2 Tax=Crystallibacter crystallopoietes TaxID=37928 RepID=N1VAX4_9MICC|nr:aminoglycoside phosphotransferase [Arthrobacter crystallopoietes BAB-32]